jgi:cytochrome c biogenesis protein CcmG/thiol:disulfide interchange protein DsbE
MLGSLAKARLSFPFSALLVSRESRQVAICSKIGAPCRELSGDMTRITLRPFAILTVLGVLVSSGLPAPGEGEGPCQSEPAATGLQIPKRIWARDLLWTDAPKLEVEDWLTDKPELEGKFILVEFWRTWCGACRRMSPLMNELHRKYGDELVVVGITGEPVDKVKAELPKWKKDYFLAIDKPGPKAAAEGKKAPAPAGKEDLDVREPDTASEDRILRPQEQGAYEAKFGVWGWPHVVLLEPEHGAVIWQGFPGLKGYELTVEKVGKYLERGRKASEAAKED